MRQILPFLLICFFILKAQNAKAQFYIDSNISVIISSNFSHDSNTCATNIMTDAFFTVNNSYAGQVIRIIDQFGGFQIDTLVNTTGQNPWYANYTLMYNYLPDNSLIGGNMAFSYTSTYKFIADFDTIYNAFGNASYIVPDPCVYDTVSGRVYVDNNSDCVFNTGDLDLNMVQIDNYTNLNSPSTTMASNYTYTNNGYYNMIVQKSWMTSYSIGLGGAFPFMFPSVPCSAPIYTFTTLPQANVNFAVSCSGNIDVQSGALAPNAVRTAMPFVLQPYVSNIGCDSASGILTVILDPNVTYNATLSSNPATSVNGDTLKWNYANLTNIANGGYWNSFFAGVYLIPDTSLSAGDTVCFTISSTILSNDVNPINNFQTFCLPVQNSYDPNIKEVSPKGITANGNIPDTTSTLTYTIHFQNTGNAVAYHVVVKDTLESDIIPNSLRIISASHNCAPRWNSSNALEFDFWNIMLPDSTSNEPQSHGAVKFSVKLKSGLTTGTQIKNNAAIYFDFNAPIITNTALNTIGLPTTPEQIADFSGSKEINVYPNPTNDKLQIAFDGKINSKTVLSVYNINGELVYTNKVLKINQTIDVSEFSEGVYFIKINSNDNTYFKKFVKQ